MAGPLVPSGSSSGGFRQTGVVNWTDLSTRTVEFAFGALNRFSKADVDVSTVATGQLICMSFEMPYENKKKILNHIQTLPQISVYGTLLRYGFGLRHVIQDICDRDPGLICVSLCGCLRENYDSFFGSQVLRSMCKQQKIPEDMIPGTQRWRALLNICAGLFATTEFPKLVYGLTHFVWPKPEYGAAQLGATDPKHLAEAILVLAKISTGELESCTFSGGIDCAWLGAVANYLFGLSVSVKQVDGLVSFQTKTGRRLFDAESQVNILQSQAGGSSIDILRTAVYLPSGKDMFRASQVTEKSYTSQFEIRAHWDSILKDSFGAATETLLEREMSTSFVKLMVFLIERCQDQTTRTFRKPREYTHHWPDILYDHHALESGTFLDFASSSLPELRPSIEKARHLQLGGISESDAKRSLMEIREACCCSVCADSDYLKTGDACLVGLSFTLIRFVGLLSIAKIHDILPAPLGLQRLYRKSELRRNGPHLRGAIDTCPVGLSCPLYEILMLFSSSPEARLISDHHEKTLAISAEGICCFYEFARDIKCHPSRVAKVVVMPGLIELAGSTYQILEDISIGREDEITMPITINHKLKNVSIEREDETTSCFKYPPLREYGFYISETRDPNTLQIACTSKSQDGGLSAFVNASSVVRWAQRNFLVRINECSEDLTPTSDSLSENSSAFSTRRIVWELDGPISIPELCQHSAMEAQPSLISTILDRGGLHVEKVTVDYWKHPKADISELYAEYGRLVMDEWHGCRAIDRSHARSKIREMSLVDVDIAEISDCPRCILTFVWYTYHSSWTDLDSKQDIPGSVAIHYFDKTVKTNFRLNVLEDLRRSPEVTPQSTSPHPEPTRVFDVPNQSKKKKRRYKRRQAHILFKHNLPHTGR